MRKLLFNGFVVVFLALFVVLWGLVIFQVLTHGSTESAPVPVFGSFLIQVATLVGGTLATATATSLGFEIQKQYALRSTDLTLSSVVKSLDWPILASVAGYVLVGLVVVVVVATNQDASPEFVTAFALTWVGWLAGGFAAALKGAD